MKVFFRIASIMLVICMMLPLTLINLSAAEANTQQTPGYVQDSTQEDVVLETITPTNDDLRFFGYGYNVFAGIDVLDSENMFTYNPILDVKNANLVENIKADTLKIDINNSRSQYLMSETARGIAEQKSQYLNAAIGKNVKVGICNASLEASFSMTSAFDKEQIVNEKYELFYKIQKRKVVKTTLSSKELSRYLSDDFISALKSVKDDKSALLLLQNYGTHMPTGYTLGGVLEFSSRYASIDESYQSAVTTTLDAAVESGIEDNKAGIDASFQSKYVSKIDSSKAELHYEANVYGGVSFPDLSISQAFTHNFVQGTFVYQAWIDAINEGKNLQIVNFPKGVNMIPIWDLIPEDMENGIEIRTKLVNTYIKACDDKYAEFCEKFPTSVDSFEPSDNTTDYERYNPNEKFFLTGYLTEKNNLVTNSVLFGNSEAKSGVAYVGEKIQLAFDHDFEKGDGLVEWRIVDGEEVAKVIDARYGIIETTDDGTFIAKLYYEGEEVLNSEIQFNVKRNVFSGGTGTEADPYVIADKKDFKNLVNSPDSWSSHFILIKDLDFTGETDILPIGRDSKKFTGSFNGNNCTLSNITITALNSDDTNAGLFGSLAGTVKNLTLDTCKVKISVSDITLDGDYKLYVGALAGEMSSGAVVNSCALKSCLATSTLVTQDSGSEYSYLYTGVLAGKISNATVTDVEVSGNAYALNNRSACKRNKADTFVGLFAGYIDTVTAENIVLHSAKQISANTQSGRNNMFDYPNANTGAGTIAGWYCGNGSISKVYIYDIYNADSGASAIYTASTADDPDQIEHEKYKGAAFGKIDKNEANAKSIYFRLHASDSNSYSFYQGKDFNESNEWYQKASSFDFASLNALTNTSFKISGTTPYLSRSLQWSVSYAGKGVFKDNSTVNLNGVKINDNTTPKHYIFSISRSAEDVFTVYVTYFNTTKKFTIDKLEVENTRLELANEPTKQEYIEGTTFDPTGMQLYLRRNDGTKLLLEPSDLDEISTSKIKVGKNAIKCKYGDLEYIVDVTGYRKDDVSEITVESYDKSSKYFAGQPYNLSSIVLTGKHKSNESVDIDVADCEIVGASSLGNGKNTVIVSYGDYVTTSFTVDAEIAEMTGITAMVNPLKTYYVGQTITEEDVIVTATYEDKTTRTLSTSEYSINADKLVEGNNKVSVSVGTFNCSTTVSAQSVIVVSISAEISYTGIFYAGDVLENDQIVVNATYNNGETRAVPSTDFVIASHTLVAGDNTLTVVYAGKACTITLTAIEAPVTSMSAVASSAVEYYSGDTVKAELITVTVTYANGNTEVLNSSEFKIEPHTLTIGQNTILISYAGKTCTVSINAIAPSLVSISATSKQGATFVAGTSVANDQIVVSATYNNGAVVELTSTQFEISNHALLEGNNTITITFAGKACTLVVVAIPASTGEGGNETPTPTPNPDEDENETPNPNPSPDDNENETPAPGGEKNPIFAEIKALKDKGITVSSRGEIKQLKQKLIYITGSDKQLAESQIQELSNAYSACVVATNEDFNIEKATASSIISVSVSIKPQAVLYFDERKRGYAVC